VTTDKGLSVEELANVSGISLYRAKEQLEVHIARQSTRSQVISSAHAHCVRRGDAMSLFAGDCLCCMLICLQGAEARGVLARDESIQGVRYFSNLFLLAE
jgi:hypothetical protein